MSDQDFNFNPPPRREAKKPFEPPPWEKEQFEELARRKEAERVAAEALAVAAAQKLAAEAATPTAAEKPTEAGLPAGVAAAVPPGAAPTAPAAVQPPAMTQTAPPGASVAEPAPEAVGQQPQPAPQPPELNDPRIDAMLVGLKNEEPSFGEDIWKVSVAAGAVLAAIGAVFVVWGIVGLATTRNAGFAGSFGGAVLATFGLVFAGIGAWMIFRALRQRGVL